MALTHFYVDARPANEFWGNRGLVRFVVYAGAFSAPLLAFAVVGVGDKFGSLTGASHYGFAFLASVVLALVVAPMHALPRIARASVATALFHLLVLSYAVAMWTAHLPMATVKAEIYLELLLSVPLAEMFAVIALVVVLCTFADLFAAHKRRAPRWTRLLSNFALAHMLVLGLWAPLIALASGPDATPARLVQAALLPSTCGALGLLYVVRRVSGHVNWRAVTVAVLIAAPVIALAVLGGSAVQLNHYANLLVFVVIDAALVLAALLANALCQWWSLRLVRADLSRPAPWIQEGVAMADNGVIAWCEDRGPLLGVVYRVRDFRLRTAEHGVIEIPGARLVAQLPSSSTAIRPGERMVMIPAGARVRVAGFVQGRGDGPYRSSGRPVPGSNGLVVLPRSARPIRPSRELLFALWRPAALYLVVSIGAWLPAIAAAVVSPGAP